METNQTHINHAAYQAKAKQMTEEQLRFTIKDAIEAMEANPEGHKAGYYADEVCYCGMELKRRGWYNEHKESIMVWRLF